MILLTERFHLVVECPRCERPVHLTPAAPVALHPDGSVEFDREPLNAALHLHLRLGCDRS